MAKKYHITIVIGSEDNVELGDCNITIEVSDDADPQEVLDELADAAYETEL